MKVTGFTKLAGAGALALAATVSAHAGSVSQPGSTVGIATGSPLAPGWYFIDTADWGVRDTGPVTGRQEVGVNIPLVAWSTPWTFLNGRVQFLFALPTVEEGVFTGSAPFTLGNAGAFNAGLYNPFFAGQLAWDLWRTGWGFSYQFGAFFGVDSPVAFNSSSLNQAFALSYTRDGWNLTANLIWGTQINSEVNPDYLNLDLTATKKFGNWEAGLVGYGSTDLNHTALATLTTGIPGRQSQFALGGLVGYNFGQVILQAYATRDIAQSNYGGYDTRVWGRIIIPFLDPLPPAPAPLIRR